MNERFLNTAKEPNALRQAVRNWLVAELLLVKRQRRGLLRLISPWVTDSEVLSPSVPWHGVLSGGNHDCRSVLDLLLEYVRAGGEVRLLVRKPDADYLAAQVASMLRNWPGRVLPGTTIQCAENLHAKVWVGEVMGFFGSSNLTQSGLGLNLELMNAVGRGPKLQELAQHADTFFRAADVTPLGD